MKTLLSAVLLLFVAVSVAYLALSGGSLQQREAPPAPQPEAIGRAGESGDEKGTAKTAGGATTIAYYFHRTARCRTCRALESNAREAIQSNLADELAKGLLSIQALNVEEPANRRFIEEYQITGPALVLSYTQEGKEIRWRNLNRIWDLIRAPNEYRSYVIAEIRSFMSGKP